MNLSPLTPGIAKAVSLYRKGMVYACLQELKSLAADTPDVLLAVRKAENTYFFMLRYMASADDSSSTSADYARLLDSLESILAWQEDNMAAKAGDRRGAQLRFQRMRPEETLLSIAGDYLAELQRIRTDTTALTDTRLRAGLERLADDIFMRLWAGNSLSEEELALLVSLVSDASVPDHDRVLWIAAIGLGARSIGTAARITVLEAAHADANEDVSAMAAIWLTIIAGADSKARKPLLRNMEERRAGDACEVLSAFVNALPSDKRISLSPSEMRRLNDIGRRLSEAMNNKPADADTSEYLSSVLKPEDGELMRRFTRMQMQGGDAFSRTLGNMRHNPFFGRLGNWFLPFHTDHSALAPIVDGEGMALADMLSKIPNLCAGDKYALLLSLAGMVGPIRGAALSQLVDQLYRMNDNEDFREAMESISNLPRSMTVMRHVQNLMRFVNNHPSARELWPDGITAAGLAALAPDVCGDRLAAFAKMLSAAGRHTEAESIYDTLADKEHNVEILRDAARNASAAGKHDKAIGLLCRALDIAPGERDIVLDLASQYAAEGMAGKAFDLLQPYAGDMEDDPAALSIYAYAASGAHHWEEAAAAFHSIDEKNGGKDRKAQQAMAMALFAGGDLYGASEIHASQASSGRMPEDVERAAVAWFGGSKNEALNILLPHAASEDGIAQIAGRLAKLRADLAESPVALANPVAYDELAFIPDILRFKLSGTDAAMSLDIF